MDYSKIQISSRKNNPTVLPIRFAKGLLSKFELYNLFNRSKDSRTFNSYRRYETFMKVLQNKLSLVCKINDVNRATKITWNAVHSGPPFIVEKEFKKLFPEVQIPDVNIKEKTLEEREKVSHELQIKSPGSHAFLRKNKTYLFNKLDECLNLKGKKFNTMFVHDAVDFLPQSTSSAFPKFNKKHFNRDEMIQKLYSVLKTADISWIYYPTVIRWRTQQRMSGPKFRQFFMFAHLILCIEAYFFGNIIKYITNDPQSSYCSGDTFISLRQKIIRLKQNGRYIVSGDIKMFDVSLSIELLYTAYIYLKSKIYFKNRRESLIYNALMFYGCFCVVFSIHNGIPTQFIKKRGLMSGSLTTNLIGTIINLILIISYLKTNDCEVSYKTILAMGDDSLASTNKYLSLDMLASFLYEEYGIILSVDKSVLYDLSKGETTVFFLGYEMDENGRYANFELFKKQLVFTEQYISEEVLSTKARLFSKLASISFKCSDGYKFWDIYAPKLAANLGCEVPEYFYDIYSRDFSSKGERDKKYTVKKSISSYKYNGWLNQ